MRTFIWWLRSAFCKHDWKDVNAYVVEKTWPPSMVGQITAEILVKECNKCGWRWQQRTGVTR